MIQLHPESFTPDLLKSKEGKKSYLKLLESLEDVANANTNLQAFILLVMKYADMIMPVENIPYIVVPEILGHYSNYEDFDIEMNKPIYDSRKATKNTTFVALRGTVTDGHHYIEDVIKKGCKLIFCEEIPENIKSNIKQYLDKNVSFVEVKNSRILLAFFSHFYYDNDGQFEDIFAVTGTNGKTTVSYILKEIFENQDSNVGLIGTTGIYYAGKKIEATHTTPESSDLAKIISDMRKKDVDTIVMEVSSHALEQYRVANIRFSGAIFTNLTHDHLDYHKTMDNYANAKKLLFDSLNKYAFAVVNGNDKYADYMVKDTKAEVVYINFNHNEKNEEKNAVKTHKNKKIKTYLVDNIDVSLNGINFDLQEKSESIKTNKTKKSHTFKSKLIGKFNVENIALATALCLQFDSDSEGIKELKSITSKINGAKGRMESYKLKNGAIAVIDYAHTPDALEKALKTLDEVRQSNVQSRLLVIFGCGGDRDKTKRPIMGKISSEIADIVILTDDNPRTELNTDITNEIIAGIDEKLIGKIKIINDRKEAIKFTLENSKSNDIILIAGKGHEDYQIIGTKKIHLSDEEEVLRFL